MNLHTGFAPSRLQTPPQAAPLALQPPQSGGVKSESTEVPAQQSESYRPQTESPVSTALSPNSEVLDPLASEPEAVKQAPYQSPAATVLQGDGHPGSDLERLVGLESPPPSAEPLGYLTAESFMKDLKEFKTIQSQIMAEMEQSRLQRQQMMSSFFQEAISGPGYSHDKTIRNFLSDL